MDNPTRILLAVGTIVLLIIPIYFSKKIDSPANNSIDLADSQQVKLTLDIIKKLPKVDTLRSKTEISYYIHTKEVKMQIIHWFAIPYEQPDNWDIIAYKFDGSHFYVPPQAYPKVIEYVQWAAASKNTDSAISVGYFDSIRPNAVFQGSNPSGKLTSDNGK